MSNSNLETCKNQNPPVPATGTEIQVSCRVPLLILFLSGAVWLVIGSVFALISSIKFHSPGFLADTAWLTYGRVRPSFTNSVLYGFCVQSGLGVGLWLLAHLGATRLRQSWLAILGAVFWNLGVTIGVAGILAGDSTGFENLEMPGYAAPFVCLGYLMFGLCAAFTFHQRRERSLFVSQWFFFTALFWFAWIYSTAELLLVTFPVRGVVQPVIAWWFSANLQVVWLWLVGLAAVFYLVPRLTERDLEGRYLALFAYWMIVLFGSWSGIPNTAPVPAWLPALSTVGTVLTAVPLVAIGLGVYQTAGGRVSAFTGSCVLRFTGFGVCALLLYGFLRILGALPAVSEVVQMTWFTAAEAQLNSYGFFALVMFAAVYHILPQVVGLAFPSARPIRFHFWLATSGIVLVFVPLVVAGILEGLQLQNANISFDSIIKGTLPFLRVSTVGDLLIAAGNVVFLANAVRLALQLYRARAASAYEAATADLFKAQEAKA